MAKRRAIGYVRVSTTEQVNGFGLDVQRQAIKRYCKDHSFTLASILADEGQSGSNGLEARQGLATALALIEGGEPASLVVYRLDRLARDLRLQLTVIEQLERAGHQVVSVTEPDVDGPDELRDLIRNLLGSIAQYERALIRGRMMAGKAAKIAKGGYGGGRPRFGYSAKDKALVPEDKEQETLSRVYQLRSEGLSLRQIAFQLEAEGRKPKGGGRWHPVTIARVLERSP